MENFKKCVDLSFQDDSLNILINQLNKLFNLYSDNFAEICRCVNNIHKNFGDRYYVKLNNDSYICYNSLLERFGISKTTGNDMINCYKKFCEETLGYCTIASPFTDFSPSKLYIMLKVSNDTLIQDINAGLLSPTMSCKEIKEYIKSKNKTASKVIEDLSDDEDITKDSIKDDEEETFFNVNKHYDMEFFENCDKSQLVSIAWSLQFELEKYIRR